ncbi:hypothetical protein KIM67_02165 [Flagellimonas sp. 389]|nr:hypothetical protein [Flagellimonas sp. 389]
MKKGIVLFLLLGVFTFFISCDLDDDTPNFHFTTLTVLEANVPESFELNRTYDIEVTYLRPDSCTFFEGYDVVKTAQTERNIAMIGTVLTDETACAQAVEEVEAIFRFNVIFTGEYTFRFYAGTNDNDEAVYLEYIIPVDAESTN